MSPTFIQLADEFINLEHVAYAQLQPPPKGNDDETQRVLLVVLVSGQTFRYQGEKMQALLTALQQRTEAATTSGS